MFFFFLQNINNFEEIYFSYHEEFLNWKLWVLQPSYCHPPKNNKYDSVSSDSFQFFQSEHLPGSKNGISESKKRLNVIVFTGKP